VAKTIREVEQLSYIFPKHGCCGSCDCIIPPQREVSESIGAGTTVTILEHLDWRLSMSGVSVSIRNCPFCGMRPPIVTEDDL